MSGLVIPGLHILRNDGLSKKHHVLRQKNRGCWSRKDYLAEKMAFFAVFGNILADRWLHGYLIVNGQFTNNEFARGKVSVCERPCFVV